MNTLGFYKKKYDKQNERNSFSRWFEYSSYPITKGVNSWRRTKVFVFVYGVADSERYRVADFDDKNGNVLTIGKKSQNPRSNYAIVGL